MLKRIHKGWEIHRSISLKGYWIYKRVTYGYNKDDIYLSIKGAQIRWSEVFNPKYDAISVNELFAFKTVNRAMDAIDSLDFIKENEMMI